MHEEVYAKHGVAKVFGTHPPLGSAKPDLVSRAALTKTDLYPCIQHFSLCPRTRSQTWLSSINNIVT